MQPQLHSIDLNHPAVHAVVKRSKLLRNHGLSDGRKIHTDCCGPQEIPLAVQHGDYVYCPEHFVEMLETAVRLGVTSPNVLYGILFGK